VCIDACQHRVEGGFELRGGCNGWCIDLYATLQEFRLYARVFAELIRECEDAVGKFPEAAKQAVDSTMEQLKEMQREAASSIVIPEAGGGMPGGGKIQIP
jgi:hypothetical protein